MGTRCNVVINYEETKINLYRHWDGYYSETGYDLAVRLNHSFNKIGNANAEKFFDSVFNAQRSVSVHDMDKKQYELTTELHGDIEYLYEFTFYRNNPKVVGVVFKHREYAQGWYTGYEAKITKENIGSLIDWVLQERIQMRKRASKIAI